MVGPLQKQWCEVGCSGELVLLKLGDVRVSIEFPLALQIAAALRHEARIAKLNSGRDGRGLQVLGMLHDAAAPRPRRKRFGEQLPKLLHPRGVEVDSEGQLVRLTMGRMIARFPYDAARTLAQWLRVRGKQAKADAGEHRHWSEIEGVPAAMNGHRSW